MRGHKLIVLFTLLMIILPSTIFANDPKDYIPAPPGTNAVLFYYDHISGSDAYSRGNKISDAANLTGNIAVFRYAYWNEIGKFPWAVSALLPYGNLSLDNAGPTNQSISTSQIGDPIFLGVIWPIAKPSTRTWLAFAQYIIPPLGEYTNQKPSGLQLGSNRWTFKEEVGFVQGFGPFELDISGFIQLYTDNGKYTSSNLTSVNDPLYHMEAHFIWDINKTFFISADYLYDNGGETKVAGVKQNDNLNDHTAGITIGYNITSSSQILLKGRETIQTENGIKKTDIGLRFAFFF